VREKKNLTQRRKERKEMRSNLFSFALFAPLREIFFFSEFAAQSLRPFLGALQFPL
jgi:hypothetical protein